MANIVLAHGILGYREHALLGWTFQPGYFNRVKSLFERAGHQVIAPSVPTLGSLQERSAELKRQIDERWPGGHDLILIGHSMGGLDIRKAAATTDLGCRVRAIATIATPLFGSPVASALLNPEHPLAAAIPSWLRAQIGESAPALRDLMLERVPGFGQLQDPDVDAIAYFEIGTNAVGGPASSPLFGLTRAIGALDSSGNDGVVTISSAKHPARELHEVWPLDHGAAIGWPSGFGGLAALPALLSPPSGHLERYQSLLGHVLRHAPERQTR